MSNVRTAEDTLRFANQFIGGAVNINEIWTGGATAADLDRLLPGQLINSQGGVGFFNGSILDTTQQGFYVAGTWNNGTFTVSAPNAPGNDALVFTVAGGTNSTSTNYGAFASSTLARDFFISGSSAFILDFV